MFAFTNYLTLFTIPFLSFGKLLKSRISKERTNFSHLSLLLYPCLLPLAQSATINYLSSGLAILRSQRKRRRGAEIFPQRFTMKNGPSTGNINILRSRPHILKLSAIY